jgi:HAD superfamily hydrolase (TIGR01484 family)
MVKLTDCDPQVLAAIRVVLCDLDDTLTLGGKLPAEAYGALEAIAKGGRKTIVVTGRPAGWCDLIARLWPVDGVVGENGAFYFRYDAARRQMIRRFLRTDEERTQDRATLKAWFAALKQAHPQIKLSADQDYRISDIAIDVCEDVAPLADAEVQEIIAALTLLGATVKLSSIHVNAWIGQFDKLSMSKTYLADELGIAPSELTKRVLYIGDSPNDEPMFRFFTATVGVQNIAKYLGVMAAGPAFLTEQPGGLGFAEMVRRLNSVPPG